MGIGGLLQVLTAYRQLRIDRHSLWHHRQLILLGAGGVVIYPLTFYSAMHLAGVAIGTVVAIGAAPFATALLEWRLQRKSPLSVRWCSSAVLGLIGMVLLTFAKQPEHQGAVSNTTLWGIFLGLCAAATYALYTSLGKRLIEQGIHSKSAIGSMFLLASIVLLPSLWFTGGTLFSNVTNASVAVYMAVVPMFIGYLLFGFGLRSSHASKATLLTLFEPVVAALLAVTIVGEYISAWGWFGMLLIGVCLVLQASERDAKPLQPSPPTDGEDQS